MRYIAFCTKGLEQVVKDEIEETITDAGIEQLSGKRVIFTSNKSFSYLLHFRTVDDLGVLLFSARSNSQDEIVSQIVKSDLGSIRQQLSEFRDVGTNQFSITTSIMGNKIIRPETLKIQLSKAIEEQFQWHCDNTIHSLFDIRIFVDREDVFVSIRVSGESLHHRQNRHQSVMGALRTTVAASMVRLATKKESNLKIVDDFCGSGTILAEAFSAGEQIAGGDIDSHRIHIALENLQHIGFTQTDQLKQLNALKTNWPNEYFDCAISNLPWNKQVEVKSLTNLYIGALLEYQRIVKNNGVICLLVSEPELLIKHANKTFINPVITTYKVGLLGQTPTIVVIKRQNAS